MFADYSDHFHALDIVEMMKLYAIDPMGGGAELNSFSQNNLVDALSQIEGAFTILAYFNKKVVGLVNCIPGFSTFYCKPLINVHDLVVKKSSRGHKIAGKMLELVEREAVERGCCKLTLEVLEGNQSAQRAYRQFGFSGYELNPKMGHAMFWEKKLN